MKLRFALALGSLIGGSAAANAQAPYYATTPMASTLPMPAVVQGPMPGRLRPVQDLVPAPQPLGQPTPMTPGVAGMPMETITYGGSDVVYFDSVMPTRPRVWASAEAMCWWLQPQQLAVPTLTTFTPGSESANTGLGGGIGFPGTIVLSPDHLGYGGALGGRATVGYALSDSFAIEGSGFMTETKTARFVHVTENTSVPLRIPFINQSANSTFPLGESSFILSGFDFFNGGQTITAASQLWGAEVNGVFDRFTMNDVNYSFLVGFNYLDLKESLQMFHLTNVPAQPGIVLPGFFLAQDQFRTRNQFYGGQLGVRAERNTGMFFFSGQAKLALGNMHETIDVSGASIAKGTIPTSGPGGIFSQKSNIGYQQSDVFAIIPSLQLKAGLNITQRLRAFVGYDVLYVSNVVRPADQIDRTINFSQNLVVREGTVDVRDAPTRPISQFNHTDFWAQGISFGIEYKY